MSRRDNPNGCGACSGFWKWFKPPHHRFFKDVCDEHDRAYDIGGGWIDRKIADLILLRDMRLKVKSYFYKRKSLSILWFLILCACYYIGVRIFGRGSYNMKL